MKRGWLAFGLGALFITAGFGPAQAADASVTLPGYDCASAQTSQAPTRRIAQIIDGTAYFWREYLSTAADPSPICLVQIKPSAATLSKADAQALLARSMQVGAPAQSGNMQRNGILQSGDPAPSVPVIAETLRRVDRSKAIDGAQPASLKSGDSVERQTKAQAGVLPAAGTQAGSGQTAKAVVANDNRTAVSSTTVFPFNTVVYIVSEYPNGVAARCSGVLVSPYVVMTAGHCVHNNDRGGFASKVTVVPGQYQSPSGSPIRPFGSQVAQSVATTLAWQTFSGPESQAIVNFKHDLGTVRLASPITFTNTFMPIIFDDAATNVISDGYPATDPAGNSSYGQWTAQGAQSKDSINQHYHNIGLAEYAIAVSPGNSGGPYWKKDATGRQLLVGITSYGDDTTGTSGGPYYGAFNSVLVASWLTWTPVNPVADLVAAANTVFAKAVAVTGEAGTVTGSNAGAAIEKGSPAAAGSGGQRIAWWQWTAPRTGYVTIDTIGSNFDTALGVYTGISVDKLTQIAANDDITDGVVQQSRIAFLANAGTTYSIGVDGYNGDQGQINLNWSMASDLFPDTGWYYEAANSGGRGFAIETQPDPNSANKGHIFFSVYQYDTNGRAIWQIADLSPVTAPVAATTTTTITTTTGTGTGTTTTPAPAPPPGQFTGTLTQVALQADGTAKSTSLGQMNLNVIQPQPVTTTTSTTAATGTTDTTGTTGTSTPPAIPVIQNTIQIIWPQGVGGASLQLQRFPFDGKTLPSPSSAIIAQAGWWSAPSQAGRGLMFEVQGTTAFAGYFTYRTDGSPVWYFALGAMSADGAGFDGTLSEAGGGPGFYGPTTGISTSTPRGTISLRFNSANTGTIALGSNAPIALTRFNQF
jgi:V8-like Glu-specific endopeptidase